MKIHTIDIKKGILLLLFTFFISCTVKESIANNSNEVKVLKSFEYYGKSTNKDTIYYFCNNFLIKKFLKKNESSIFFENKIILNYNSEVTSTLLEQFDKNFLIISECIRNSMVAEPMLLKRKKLWIIDTNSKNIYSVDLDNILINSEKSVRRYNGIPHHQNSAYGLVSIDIIEQKLNLLESTQKIKSLNLNLIKNN